MSEHPRPHDNKPVNSYEQLAVPGVFPNLDLTDIEMLSEAIRTAQESAYWRKIGKEIVKLDQSLKEILGIKDNEAR